MDISLIKLIIHWHLIPVWTGLLHSGCVRDPYVLLKGTISTNESVQKLSCQDFKLYTCLNSSLYNFNHSFVTLRRRLQIWLPVNQTRPWEGSPETHALWKIIKEVLQRSKSFTGLLIAALAGIMAIATTAAAAGWLRITLHQRLPLYKSSAKCKLCLGKSDPHRPRNEWPIDWFRKFSSPTRGQSAKFKITGSP